MHSIEALLELGSYWGGFFKELEHFDRLQIKAEAYSQGSYRPINAAEELTLRELIVDDIMDS